MNKNIEKLKLAFMLSAIGIVGIFLGIYLATAFIANQIIEASR